MTILELLFFLFICGLVYYNREKIKFFFSQENYTKNREDAKIKKAVEKLENERLTREEIEIEREEIEIEIEDNIQLAGVLLKDFVRYFVYQLISSLITAVISSFAFHESIELGGIMVFIGSVVTLIFSIKMMLSIWKAGNCLINHKKTIS